MTGYLYILKHGIGPGTMPSDVTILKEKDLPNYYTAVWLDRFLTTSELKQYDIPSETRINELLNRIDYCQADNGDDVVPCDDVEACDKVVASELSNIKYVQSDSNFSPEQYDYSLPLPKYISFCGCGGRSWVSLTSDNLDTWDSCEAAVDDARQNYKPGTTIYIYKIDMNNRSVLENCEEVVIPYVEACGDIKASKKIVASKMSDIDLLMNEALECTTKDELSAVISGLDSLGLRKLYLHYMEMLRDDSLSVGYIASDLSDTLYNMFSGKVEACDKVMASYDYKLFDELANYYSSYDSMSLSEIWDEVYNKYNDEALANDVVAEVEDARASEDEDEDDDIWGATEAESKYFANMVNCSSDPEFDDDFLIEGYYDSQRRGLAESAETSDVSALNDLANEYANKGYYIVVHNLTDGVITEFSADNWFNDIAPDGGAELFMSW